MNHDTQHEFAERWFGYGRWASPYWFVGMEPGGAEADANIALWEQAGRPELSDLTVGLPGQKDWFGSGSPTQSTWAKLVWLLLAYKGLEPTSEATLKYQREQLGRLNEETAFIELSPFAAMSTSIAEPRSVGRERRLTTIAAHLRDDAPMFAVFYSGDQSYLESWQKIVGQPMTEGEPVLVGTTACVVTYHPQYKRGKAYWIEIAERLRKIREPMN